MLIQRKQFFKTHRTVARKCLGGGQLLEKWTFSIAEHLSERTYVRSGEGVGGEFFLAYFYL